MDSSATQYLKAHVSVYEEALAGEITSISISHWTLRDSKMGPTGIKQNLFHEDKYQYFS